MKRGQLVKDVLTAASMFDKSFLISDLLEIIDPPKDKIKNYRWACNNTLSDSPDYVRTNRKKGLERYWKKRGVKDDASESTTSNGINPRKITPLQIGEGVMAKFEEMQKEISNLKSDLAVMLEEKKGLEQLVRKLKDQAISSSNKTINLSNFVGGK